MGKAQESLENRTELVKGAVRHHSAQEKRPAEVLALREQGGVGIVEQSRKNEVIRKGVGHILRGSLCPLLLFVLGSSLAAAEGSFDLGLGLGFADAASSEGFDGGWDVQFGYEWEHRPKWYIGTQVHLLQGWNSASDLTADDDMSFDSVAANLTFRPKSSALSWVQMKAGIVYADYQTIRINQSGVGLAAGFGLVMNPNGRVRLHLLDYSRYEIEGDGFNIYTLSLALLFH